MLKGCGRSTLAVLKYLHDILPLIHAMGTLSEELPSFSIIIPTYARPDRLDKCLESLTHLNYPRDRFDIIVVVDDTENLPLSIVSKYSDLINIKLLSQKHSGPAAARNRGAMEAKGKFLAFTDDDCKADSEWLKVLASQLVKSPNSMVGGHTINALTDNIYSTVSQLIIDYLYLSFNKHENRRFFTSNNMAMATERFWEIGGFNEKNFRLAAAEDKELCERWLKRGYQLIYRPEAIIFHLHKMRLGSFCRQHFNYGCGNFDLRKLHRQRGDKSPKVDVLNFYFNLMRYSISQSSSYNHISILILVTISAIANKMGVLWSWFRSQDV